MQTYSVSSSNATGLYPVFLNPLGSYSSSESDTVRVVPFACNVTHIWAAQTANKSLVNSKTFSVYKNQETELASCTLGAGVLSCSASGGSLNAGDFVSVRVSGNNETLFSTGTGLTATVTCR